MIRRTLPATKAATFCVLLPVPGTRYPIHPTGTGFFVSPDGHFVTARHVVAVGGTLRTDLDAMELVRENPDQSLSVTMRDLKVEVVGEDIAADFVLLKIEQGGQTDILNPTPFIVLTSRLLDDGEPVYAFGYPLGATRDLSGSRGVSAPPGIVHGPTHYPRVTSAIIASQFHEYKPITFRNDPHLYAIDKPLNFGNSGGPIVAVESGKAFAICSAFQAMGMPQDHLGISPSPVVAVPSLYGYVTSLANPGIVAILTRNGIPLDRD
jgi:serine protease Do